MTYPKTLAASATYDITAEGARVSGIKLTSNPGSGTVYYGDIPQAPIVRTGVEANVDDDFITLASSADGLAIQQGMAVSGGNSNLDPAAVVTRVEGNKVYLSEPNVDTEAGLSVTFTPPAISTTNGHPISAGESHFLSAEDWNLQHGLRLVADGAGASLIITKKLA